MKNRKNPFENFNEAIQEFNTAMKLRREQEQDTVFAKENPDRIHWMRPVGEIETYAELFFKGHRAGPKERLYYVVKRAPKGIRKLTICGNPDDPCDLSEDEARQVWTKAAADNF